MSEETTTVEEVETPVELAKEKEDDLTVNIEESVSE